MSEAMALRRSVMCGGAVALLLLGPERLVTLQGQNPPPAQTGSQQPTFRSTTNLVEVDVIVLDDNGRFVPGLLADDVTLVEDGKPQAIQQFYMVTHDPTRPVASGVASAVTGDRGHRVFVVLFDEGHLAVDSLQRVKRGAEQFLREQFGPGDLGGIFASGTMFRGKLTPSRAELIAGVQSVKPEIDNRQALLAPFREFPRIPSEVDAYRIEGGARELVDQLGVEACRQEAFLCQDSGGLNQVENLIQKKARHYVRQARVLTTTSLQNLQNVISSLSRIPGRKTIVLLSEGFFVEESRSTLQMLAAQAARGGATIYSIDGRGQTHGNSPPSDVLSASMGRSTTFDTADDGPTILTEGTGGLAVRNVDDIGRAFGLVARDTSTYYVIGYQPTNAAMDGKFRKIEVRAKAGGLKIRARKGYVASPLPAVR
jgi:VWFA-related protein